jgi:hypothetical protein
VAPSEGARGSAMRAPDLVNECVTLERCGCEERSQEEDKVGEEGGGAKNKGS